MFPTLLRLAQASAISIFTGTSGVNGKWIFQKNFIKKSEPGSIVLQKYEGVRPRFERYFIYFSKMTFPGMNYSISK